MHFFKIKIDKNIKNQIEIFSKVQNFRKRKNTFKIQCSDKRNTFFSASMKFDMFNFYQQKQQHDDGNNKCTCPKEYRRPLKMCR